MPVEIGKTYGRLTVLYKCEEPYISPSGYRASKYHVICSCENRTQFDVIGASLTSGNTKSCGCLAMEHAKTKLMKAGEKTRFKLKGEGNNSYDLTGEYGIGYTYDTKEPFYFDLEDYDKIKNYHWYFKDSGYIISLPSEGTIYLHRLVMNCEDPNKDVDHIFHNKEDCRKKNLRICEHFENMISQKIRIDNISGVKGICFDKNREKWMAYITYNKKRINLGRFSNKEDAIKKRKEAEELYFREYNYIDKEYTIEETT